MVSEIEMVENVIVSPPPEEDVVAGVEGGNISKLSSLPLPPSSRLPNASSPVSLVSVQTSGASIVSKHNAAPCSTDPH